MDADQLSDFLAARCGKLTASNMSKAMSFLKNGQPSKERSDLMRCLLAERETGSNVRNFVNPAMEFGLRYEDECKQAFEIATGVIISPAVTYDHPEIDGLAATPDGLLGDDGLIECKVPTSQTFVDWVVAGVVPEQHKPQMATQCAVTGRRWCQFVAFDPRIRDPARRLFMRRYEPTPEELGAVEAAAMKFLAELDRMEELFKSAETGALNFREAA